MKKYLSCHHLVFVACGCCQFNLPPNELFATENRHSQKEAGSSSKDQVLGAFAVCFRECKQLVFDVTDPSDDVLSNQFAGKTIRGSSKTKHYSVSVGLEFVEGQQILCWRIHNPSSIFKWLMKHVFENYHLNGKSSILYGLFHGYNSFREAQSTASRSVFWG